MTQLFLLTKNHRYLKNNIFGEFVITIYRNIQPTFHYLFINRKKRSQQGYANTFKEKTKAEQQKDKDKYI